MPDSNPTCPSCGTGREIVMLNDGTTGDPVYSCGEFRCPDPFHNPTDEGDKEFIGKDLRGLEFQGDTGGLIPDSEFIGGLDSTPDEGGYGKGRCRCGPGGQPPIAGPCPIHSTPDGLAESVTRWCCPHE